eukprot:CFRG5072T1
MALATDAQSPSNDAAGSTLSLVTARDKFKSMPSLHVSAIDDSENGSPPNVPDFIDFVTQQTINLRNTLPPLDEDEGMNNGRLVKTQSMSNIQQAPPGDMSFKIHRGRGGGNPGKVRAHWPMSSQNFPVVDFPPNAKVRQVLSKQRTLVAQPAGGPEYMVPHRSPHAHTHRPYASPRDRQNGHSNQKQISGQAYSQAGSTPSGAQGQSGHQRQRYGNPPNSQPLGTASFRDIQPQGHQVGQAQAHHLTPQPTHHTQPYGQGRRTQGYISTPSKPALQTGIVVNLYDDSGEADGEVINGESTKVVPKIWRGLYSCGLLNLFNRVRGREASDDEILSVHERLLRPGTDPESMKAAMDARTAAGCVLELALQVGRGELANGFAIVRPSGHLLGPDNDETNFRLNNVAVAAAGCLNTLGLNRVAILNWDANYSSGGQAMFYDDDRVLVISMHKIMQRNSQHPLTGSIEECGDSKGIGANVNIQWPVEVEGVGDPEYLAAMRSVVMPILHSFKPEILLVQAGFTAAVGDTLGMRVTPAGFGHFTHLLKGVAGGKIVLALEGGSNSESLVECVMACSQVLSNDGLPRLPDTTVAAVPLRSCSAMMQEVIHIQKVYYPTLDRMRDLTEISLKDCVRLEEKETKQDTGSSQGQHRELDQRVESAAEALASLSFARGTQSHGTTPVLTQQDTYNQYHIASPPSQGGSYNTNVMNSTRGYAGEGQRSYPSPTRGNDPVGAQQGYRFMGVRPTINHPAQQSKVQPKAQSQRAHPKQSRRTYAPPPQVPISPQTTIEGTVTGGEYHGQPRPSPGKGYMGSERGYTGAPYHGSSAHVHASSHAYQPYDMHGHEHANRAPRSPEVTKKVKKAAQKPC